MTFGAGLLLQKFFHALHALFILDVGEGIFYCIDGIIISKIHLRDLIIVAFAPIEDVFFYGRTIVYDVLFLICKISEGYVYPYSHLAAYVGHQGPHEGVPGGYCAILYGNGIVRHEGGTVHGHDYAGTAAALAGALAVESKLFCRRSIKCFSADRTG